VKESPEAVFFGFGRVYQASQIHSARLPSSGRVNAAPKGVHESTVRTRFGWLIFCLGTACFDFMPPMLGSRVGISPEPLENTVRRIARPSTLAAHALGCLQGVMEGITLQSRPMPPNSGTGKRSRIAESSSR